MNNSIYYKGYSGTVEFSEEDNVFFGKVLGIHSLLSYEGENVKDLLDDFHGAVDDYLVYCKEEGLTPEKPAVPKWNQIQIPSELYSQLISCSQKHNVSVDRYVEDTLKKASIV